MPILMQGRSDNGNTPLHEAARRGATEIVKLLLFEKAYASNIDRPSGRKLFAFSNAIVYARNDFGNTALHEAANSGNPKVVQLLLSLSDIEAEGMDNWKPLHYASCAGNPETVKILLDRRADVNSRNKWGDMPLHVAAKNRAEAVKTLITAGADVNAIQHNGETPLHIACRSINLYKEAVKALIDAGADVNARDNSGETPIIVAYGFKRIEIVQFLIDAGADI